MKRRTFWWLWFFTLIGIVFVKLYLHNRLMYLGYREQKLAARATHLEKRLVALGIQQASAQDFVMLKGRAQRELGFRPLTIEQVQQVSLAKEIP